jgi:hypothetical protein
LVRVDGHWLIFSSAGMQAMLTGPQNAGQYSI